jgi:hypothetical protein
VVNLLIESDPGLKVHCNAEFRAGDTGYTDASGKVTIPIELKEFSVGTHEVRCSADRQEFLRNGSRDAVAHFERAPTLRLSKTRGVIECGGKPCDCIFDWKRSLTVSIKVEKGTQIEVGGKTVVSADDTERTVIEVSTGLETALPDAALAPIISGTTTLTAAVPMKVTWPDGASARVNITADARAALETMTAIFEGLENGPVKFPAEQKPTPSLLLLGDGDVLYGTAERVRDVERVAIFFYFERKESCGTYTSKTDNHAVEVTNDYRDIDLTVYERRSGKVLGKKQFPAAAVPCPSKVKAYENESEKTADYIWADKPTALAWLEKFTPPR